MTTIDNANDGSSNGEDFTDNSAKEGETINEASEGSPRKGRVVKLAEIVKESHSWTLLDMLEETIEELREDPTSYNRGILILLDTKGDDKYNTRRKVCNLRIPETVSLLDHVKFLMHMDISGYSEDELE